MTESIHQPHPRDGDRGPSPRPHERGEAEREAEADRVSPWLADRLPDVVGLRPGHVPAAMRRPAEAWAGVDLTGLALDTESDPRLFGDTTGGVAAFDGRTIHAGLAGRVQGTDLSRRILAHELVHAAQQRQMDVPEASSALRPLKLGFCGGGKTDVIDLLRSGKPLSTSDASKLLDHYEKLGPAERDRMVTEFHQAGVANTGIQRLLAALDPAELERRRALVSDVQERVQRLAALQTAGKTEDQLAAEQGAHMKAEAEKEALAAAAADAAAKGLPPPKTVPAGDVAKAQDAATKATSPVQATVTNAWDALPAPTQATWNARATKAIADVVAAANKVAPGYGIKASNIKWAPKEVAQAGANVYAFAGDPISVGMRFVETAEADPEYCVSTVIHEIAGHPDFGDRYGSFEARIYAGAHGKEPSLGAPWDTSEETNTFGYIGTEIYAAMRGLPFEKVLTPAHSKAGLVTAISAEANIDRMIGLLKAKYVPAIAAALLQGLNERFRVDPRLDPSALALFVRIAEKHFPKVLKR